MILLNLTKIFGYIISSRFKYVHYCQLSQGINTVYLSSPKCESGIEMIGIVLNISSGNSWHHACRDPFNDYYSHIAKKMITKATRKIKIT